MTKRFTDFSQLSKAIIKPKGEPKPCPVPVPKREAAASREDADASAALAHFSRPARDARERRRGRSGAIRAHRPSLGGEAHVRASGGEWRDVAADRHPSTPESRPWLPHWAVGPPSRGETIKFQVPYTLT